VSEWARYSLLHPSRPLQRVLNYPKNIASWIVDLKNTPWSGFSNILTTFLQWGWGYFSEGFSRHKCRAAALWLGWGNRLRRGPWPRWLRPLVLWGGSVDADLACGDGVSRPARQPIQESLRRLVLVLRYGWSWASGCKAIEDGVWHGGGFLSCCGDVCPHGKAESGPRRRWCVADLRWANPRGSPWAQRRSGGIQSLPWNTNIPLVYDNVRPKLRRSQSHRRASAVSVPCRAARRSTREGISASACPATYILRMLFTQWTRAHRPHRGAAMLTVAQAT